MKTIDFEGIRHLAAIIDGMPDSAVNLGSIVTGQGRGKKMHACGTTACAIGVVCLHPDFADRGISFKADQYWGSLLLINDVKYDAGSYERAGVAAFGITNKESERLFCSSYHGEWAYKEPRDLTDKQRFKRRVIAFLRKHKQPVSEAYAKGA
jgi:hypothetical protein